MTSYWVSVLMPVYNGSRYLAAALDSVVAQGEPGLEIIAVDDASQDDSVAILESYADRLDLRIIRQPAQGNWVRSTNSALSLAQGNYVCFLHQDDLWQPDRLLSLRRLADEHRGAGMLFHPVYYLDHEGRRLGTWRSPLRSGEYPPGALVERLLVQNFIAIPSPLIRRQIAESVGGLAESLWYTADWDFWLKVAEAAPIVYHETPLAGFRIHADSQTMRRTSCRDEFRHQLLAVYVPHARLWEVAHGYSRSLTRIAEFSIEVNTALVGLAHGDRPRMGKLLWHFTRLGPCGWLRYFRDSRILERVSARVRLKARVAWQGRREGY